MQADEKNRETRKRKVPILKDLIPQPNACRVNCAKPCATAYVLNGAIGSTNLILFHTSVILHD